MPVIDDLHQISALLGGQLEHQPVVEDEDACPGQGCQEAGLAAVQPGDGEVVEQAGEPLVDDREAITGGTVAESAGYPALADPGRAREILPRNSTLTF